MMTAKLFENGRSQAVRLPKSMAVSGRSLKNRGRLLQQLNFCKALTAKEHSDILLISK